MKTLTELFYRLGRIDAKIDAITAAGERDE